MRFSPVPRRRPSTGSILGGLALFIALGGTALAATGQLVNIADGTNASYLAKVDSSGALRTSSANIPLPSRPFSTYGFPPDQSYAALVEPSTSTVALNRIVAANDHNSLSAREIRIYSLTVPAGSACSLSSAYSDVRNVARYLVGPTDTVVDTLPTPLLLKPNGTRPWCLLAGAFRSGGTSGYPTLSLSGHVVSGTPPVSYSSAAPASATRADPLAAEAR